MVILKPSWTALALLTCVIFLGLFACQFWGVLAEDLWSLPGPCRGLLPPRDWSAVLQGPSSGGLLPPWFWNPDVLCLYSVCVWLPWNWRPDLGDLCWDCTLSEFSVGTSASLAFLALFLAAPLQFFFSHFGHPGCDPLFQHLKITETFTTCEQASSPPLPNERESLFSQLSLYSARLPLAESPSTVGP